MADLTMCNKNTGLYLFSKAKYNKVKKYQGYYDNNTVYTELYEHKNHYNFGYGVTCTVLNVVI